MESLSQENRKFNPNPQFVKQAKIAGMDAYKELYQKSIEKPLEFWSDVANELHWFKPWDKVLDESNAPFYQWYTNAKTNISYNCLDRQVEAGKGDKVAFYWEGEPGDKKAFTYKELLDEVCRFSNVLKSLGVKKGDRIALYLPMIPELIFAVLACARIGAVHSVIFAGFSSESIRDRVEDCQARMVITADGGYRRGKILDSLQSYA